MYQTGFVTFSTTEVILGNLEVFGGKIYQVGFVIFCSTVIKLPDLEVGFIAT